MPDQPKNIPTPYIKPDSNAYGKYSPTPANQADNSPKGNS